VHVLVCIVDNALKIIGARHRLVKDLVYDFNCFIDGLAHPTTSKIPEQRLKLELGIHVMRELTVAMLGSP
jgi:hypothetical protein